MVERHPLDPLQRATGRSMRAVLWEAEPVSFPGVHACLLGSVTARSPDRVVEATGEAATVTSGLALDDGWAVASGGFGVEPCELPGPTRTAVEEAEDLQLSDLRATAGTDGESLTLGDLRELDLADLETRLFGDRSAGGPGSDGSREGDNGTGGSRGAISGSDGSLEEGTGSGGPRDSATASDGPVDAGASDDGQGGPGQR